jgi:S-formylglutathione hydrolase FrmB
MLRNRDAGRERGAMAAILRSALLICLCAVAVPSVAQPLAPPAHSHVECSSLHSRILARSVPYCVLLPPAYTQERTRRFPVSYFLHGLGDDQRALAQIAGDSGVYDRILASGRIGQFVIIAPAGYESFFIDARDGQMPYEEFFLREFLPAMERKYRIAATGARRGVMGISMGGYAALHYAFKYPEKFAAVSATMPAVSERLPSRFSNSFLQAALERVFGDPLDAEFYEKNSPLYLARTAPLPALQRLTIYFDCGAQDRFGFDRGTRELDRLLTERGVPHEAHIYPGGHNWQFVEQHLAASLEAQSRGLHAQ